MRIKWMKSGYGKLRRKVFLQIVLMVPGACILFLVTVNFLSGHVADWMVALIQRILFVEFEDALSIYQFYVRNNMEQIIGIFILLSFCLFFYLSLSWFMRYFRQIDKGLDALLAGQEIVLSPEMETMEKKMNQVRRTLEKRETEAKLAEKRKDDLVMYLAHDICAFLTKRRICLWNRKQNMCTLRWKKHTAWRRWSMNFLRVPVIIFSSLHWKRSPLICPIC